MSSDDINLIAFDRAAQSWRRLAFDDVLAQLCGHFVKIIFMEIEFLRDLLIRQVESHQIQTENPLAQGLVMTGKDGISQIIEIAMTGVAMITLTMALAIIASHQRQRRPSGQRSWRTVS